jgi:UDP-N-acetylmuramoylalanine--D-glutamate ligase
VVGLARSGIAAALALRARGERVIGLDSGSPEGLDRLLEAGVELAIASDGLELLERVATLVKSPGVPAEAPVVARARAQGKHVLGELELAWRMLPNEFVAVTATNGKTTTVELIGHIHRKLGLPVAVAGNVGVALSGLVGSLEAQATVVCEASSFQLEDASSFAPEAAVLLNVAPDHLDRHGTFEAYREAKLRLFANQFEDDVAVLPAAFDSSSVPGRARRVTFGGDGGTGEGSGADGGTGEGDADLTVRDGWLTWRGEPLLQSAELCLPGRHNLENAMAAAAVCLARGLEADGVCAALRDFPGVAHRLERIADVDGVEFVNDSKATNVASTLVALEALAGERPRVHLILGGQGKGQDFAALAGPVAETCRAAYLIGQDAPAIASVVSEAGVETHDCATLERAVREAFSAGKPGEVVLLSPGCASFDQFADFEARGECFRALVLKLSRQ